MEVTMGWLKESTMKTRELLGEIVELEELAELVLYLSGGIGCLWLVLSTATGRSL
jgi:hypothetical protein